MKRITKNSIGVLVFLFVCFTGTYTAQGQSDTTLRFFHISFDTTLSNAPLKVFGRLNTIDNIKGIQVVVSQNQSGTPVLVNDTIYISGSHGSYYTNWNKNVSPSRGTTIYTSKLLPAGITGVLFCTATVLYKNGSKGVSTLYRLNRKP